MINFINLFVQIVNGSRSTRIKDVSCIGVPFPTVPGNKLEIILTTVRSWKLWKRKTTFRQSYVYKAKNVTSSLKTNKKYDTLQKSIYLWHPTEKYIFMTPYRKLYIYDTLQKSIYLRHPTESYIFMTPYRKVYNYDTLQKAIYLWHPTEKYIFMIPYRKVYI